MSKKQLQNRLENLFVTLEEQVLPPPVAEAPAALSWSWEVNAQGIYTQVSPEVSEALGYQPAEFIGKHFTDFSLHPSYGPKIQNLLDQELLPNEMDVSLRKSDGEWIGARLHIFRQPGSDGSAGLRGFFQIIDQVPFQPGPAPDSAASRQPLRAGGPTVPIIQSATGIAYANGKYMPAQQLWSRAAKRGLAANDLSIQQGHAKEPAAIAVPVKVREQTAGILEIVDDNRSREWSEDDRLLVQEVANQLALALENAQLYAAVQQELGERIRAEQEILQRNKDLASLNQIGQELSRLTDTEEIFRLVYSTIGSITDNRNLIIALQEKNSPLISYPIYCVDGNLEAVEPTLAGNGLIEFALKSTGILSVNSRVEEILRRENVLEPARIPLSLLGIPFTIGTRARGVVVIQNFEKENAFESLSVDLISTMMAQAATSLENAYLFAEIRSALSTLETRERYQANVARSVAALTQSGLNALPLVLENLAEAAQANRVSFGRAVEEDGNDFWQIEAIYKSERSEGHLLTLPVRLMMDEFAELYHQIHETGFYNASVLKMPKGEREFFLSLNTGTVLALAISGEHGKPHILLFENAQKDREWRREEISVLQVAADAIANTLVREGLVEQMQSTLEETENLYAASHRLALAADFQEMVAAIATGLRVAAINRGILILFDHDAVGKVNRMHVVANWYSGKGTPPPPVGTDYMPAIYQQIFLAPSPVFIDNLQDPSVERAVKDIFLQQRVGAMAILPLWAGKRQLGVMLLESEERHIFTSREIRSFPPLVDQMATSVDNLRLFEQTQQALAETEQLYKITNGISQAQDAQDLARLVAENILPRNADRVTLFAVTNGPDGEPSDLEIVGGVDIRGEQVVLGEKIPIASFPLVRSLVSDTLMVADITTYEVDQATRRTLQQMNMSAICFVPLRSGGRPVGLLLISSRRPGEFDKDEIHLLQIVGNGITVALEKQKLLREAQRRALELQTAAELARDTSSTLELDELLKRFVNSVRERFGFYHVSLYLMDEKGSNAVIREATGDAGREMREKGHKVTVGSRSVIGNVTQRGSSVVVNDVKTSPLYTPNPLLPEVRSEIALPLKSGKNIIGVLDIQSNQRNAFTQDDVTVLQILADQISIAIENARAYELSQKAFEDMKEVDRIKTQFLANMSHELRTPLNSIIGFSKVILKGIDGPINDIQKQDLTSIYNSGQHLLNLITDILDLSKLEAGKMELQFTDVNIGDLVTSVMSTAVGYVKEKPVKLIQNVPANLPIVKADQTRIRQVLLNFLSNAGKFTEEGSITVEAEVLNPDGKKPEVIVKVIDTGPGIAQQDQVKLFLPFSQVDDSPTRKTGGTGLGLSISRQLIEMHGGRIGLLWSEPGKGSCFYFTLPLTVMKEQELPREEPMQENVILCIDDDRQVISLYERYLEPYGYNVVALTNPKMAVERARQLQPLAITVDVMMPEMDGWQVMHELKNDYFTRQIPVIVCSIMEDQEKGFSLGAADYLVKPFLQEELILAINRLNKEGKIQDILVIDDSEDDRRLAQKILENEKRFHVRLANSGREGLEEIKTACPDAVVLDLFMEDMDGFQLLEELRSETLYRSLPVIILTSADLTPEQHKMLSEFGSQMLQKSALKEKELLLTLNEALAKISPSARRQNMHTTKPLPATNSLK